MASSALGPRVLLRRLREVMAERETAQKRLDKIVMLIAANVVAEVCSIYVMRQGQELELFATEGLKPEAVHKSRLRVGEGLVGTIAATAEALNLAEAQQHPAFKYLPETGEEIYHSFLGVPILRGGLVIGVLVVQNRTHRHYTERKRKPCRRRPWCWPKSSPPANCRRSRASSQRTSRISGFIISRAKYWRKALLWVMRFSTSRASSSRT